ncbi:MAG: LppX_LprAFG lipoprotein [Ktedonobacteraceae bacterium]|nr:LppX_LprAFG lipoprotein [Ktedonobacteraceae bacterium]
MSIQKKVPLLIVAMVSLVMLVSACGQLTNTGSNSSSSLTVGQVLQKSADAMKQLKSSHVDFHSATNVQTNGGTSSSATSNAQNINVQVKGNGDQQLPDQEQFNLTLNNSVNVAEILQGNKVYVKNSQGKWYVLDKSAFQNTAGNPFNGLTIDQNSLLGLLQNIKLTDNGTQSLNGVSLRHITAQLDKAALQQLINSDPHMKSMFGQQNINEVLNKTKTFLSTADVWIDETNFYVHRSELKVNMAADTSSVGNGAPNSVKTALDVLVDLSKFNEPVTINPPTDATPTNNPAAVLGNQP